MGMDVWGRNPSTPDGRYFRANIWSWRPIHALIRELCADLFDEDQLARLGFNVGAGPENGDLCVEMARRFELWLEHHGQGHSIDLGIRVAPDGRLVLPENLSQTDASATRSAYQVDDAHLKEWVRFLRACGGFEVW